MAHAPDIFFCFRQGITECLAALASVRRVHVNLNGSVQLNYKKHIVSLRFLFVHDVVISMLKSLPPPLHNG